MVDIVFEFMMLLDYLVNIKMDWYDWYFIYNGVGFSGLSAFDGLESFTAGNVLFCCDWIVI